MKGLINDLLHGSFRLVMMIIVPNSRAHKVKKERGEVKGGMEEFEGRRRGIRAAGEWCNPVSNMLHHV